MAYLPEVATVLKLAFEHEGWTYGFDAGTGTLDAGFDLDSRIGQTPLYIHLLEDVVLCHAYAPFKVAEEDRRRVMEFVTRANCGLKLGNFEMDLDTGVVCFKTTFCLTGVPLPTRGAMTELVRGALSVLEDYGNALDDVVKGRKTPSEAVPDAMVKKAVRHILDSIGAAVAGAVSVEAQRLTAVLREEGEGPGRATLWGRGETMTPVNAALVNGTASHAFELDDTGGCDHSGAVVVPAAVAAVELADRPVTGREFIDAVVIGYDVARRPLEACGAYEPHNGAGFHSLRSKYAVEI